MRFVLVKALLISAVLGLSSARTLAPAAGSARTYGNFGPQVKQSFDINPVTLFEPSFVKNDPISIATLYASLRSGVAPASIRVSSSHRNARNGVTHVYLQQVANGIDITNAVANVNVGPSGQVLSIGNSFYTNAAPVADFQRSIKKSPSQAVEALAKFLNLEVNLAKLTIASGVVSGVASYTVSGAQFALRPITSSLVYMQVGDGSSVALVWSLQVDMKDNMYNAFVDAATGEVVSLIDWVSDAVYNVYPLGINDPASGDRVIVEDPAHPVASPLGWHSQGDDNDFTNTIGNNVYAQNNPDGGTDYLNNYRPDGGDALNFDFPVDFTQDPDQYIDAATTNLFYWNNIIHDLLYVYGFDEEAGNFQQNNGDKGGKDFDGVIAFAQDGSGTNNANFATPPDGQHGRMRMYVWTATSPQRDGDLDGGIVMHEYCHGLSTRLTGGPANSNCLGWGEMGGMGEGWGDFFATVTRTTENSTRNDNFAMGDYSANEEGGIRNYLYSTDMTVNPSTYIYLGNAGYDGVHAKGAVWASILYEVYWNLVDGNGFDPDWFNVDPASLKTDDTFLSLRTGQKQVRQKKQAGLGGNVIALQLVVDGMKLQPCNPSFTEARDAIIQADEINNNGANKCALWAGFAKRGLGVDAEYQGTIIGWKGIEDFKVPEECAQH